MDIFPSFLVATLANMVLRSSPTSTFFETAFLSFVNKRPAKREALSPRRTFHTMRRASSTCCGVKSRGCVKILKAICLASRAFVSPLPNIMRSACNTVPSDVVENVSKTPMSSIFCASDVLARDRVVRNCVINLLADEETVPCLITLTVPLSCGRVRIIVADDDTSGLLETGWLCPNAEK